MTNHVHLILDPGDEPPSLGRLMKRLAARQTRYVNRLEGRTGTLWEGRYKSSPIETETYLLACCRYVELNPVRARMVADPEAYSWSSYGQKTGRSPAPWLDEEPCFRGLGSCREERVKAYDDFVRGAVATDEWKAIRAAVQRGQLTGTRRFVDEVERRLGRRIESRGRGRPWPSK